MRIFRWAATAGFFLLLYMFLLARSDPVVRHFAYHPAGWNAQDGRMRLVLLTDTHMSRPATPPQRLARIVDEINGLKPDLVLLGGDYMSTGPLAFSRYPAAEAVAPFRRIKAKYGVLAVPGNHDHWAGLGVVGHALADAGVTTLVNGAVRRGPLVIGGIDDDFTRQGDVRGTATLMRRLGGTPVLLSHSPDIFPAVPGRVGLVLAGHTHCGQVVLPLIGAPYIPSRYGARFRCGIHQNGAQTLIVSAGVGTSVLPLRFGAPPDIWVIDISP
jgi:predicted MPP superfamily phosphohydrolase